jgi:uncharacterized protein with von Willebrand factor type A (vWA) domain
LQRRRFSREFLIFCLSQSNQQKFFRSFSRSFSSPRHRLRKIKKIVTKIAAKVFTKDFLPEVFSCNEKFHEKNPANQIVAFLSGKSSDLLGVVN